MSDLCMGLTMIGVGVGLWWWLVIPKLKKEGLIFDKSAHANALWKAQQHWAEEDKRNESNS